MAESVRQVADQPLERWRVERSHRTGTLRLVLGTASILNADGVAPGAEVRVPMQRCDAVAIAKSLLAAARDADLEERGPAA